ncbi:unnamed protein product [Dicrocoelium dendriticum]|nr:unnamed protein product [Dicrocoelium dendriticum]
MHDIFPLIQSNKLTPMRPLLANQRACEKRLNVQSVAAFACGSLTASLLGWHRTFVRVYTPITSSLFSCSCCCTLLNSPYTLPLRVLFVGSADVASLPHAV